MMLITLYFLLGCAVFWVLYLASMALIRARAERKMSKVATALGFFVVLVGGLLDVLFNLTVFSLVFLEMPRELMVTKRLKRHIRGTGGWRQQLAQWLCRTLLNPFDHSGDHCD